MTFSANPRRSLAHQGERKLTIKEFIASSFSSLDSHLDRVLPDYYLFETPSGFFKFNSRHSHRAVVVAPGSSLRNKLRIVALSLGEYWNSTLTGYINRNFDEQGNLL